MMAFVFHCSWPCDIVYSEWRYGHKARDSRKLVCMYASCTLMAAHDITHNLSKEYSACGEALYSSDQGPFSDKLVLVLVIVPLHASHENLHESIKPESVAAYDDFWLCANILLLTPKCTQTSNCPCKVRPQITQGRPNSLCNLWCAGLR